MLYMSVACRWSRLHVWRYGYSRAMHVIAFHAGTLSGWHHSVPSDLRLILFFASVLRLHGSGVSLQGVGVFMELAFQHGEGAM